MTQKRAGQSSQHASQRGGRAWGATSNVAAALQPHVKRAFIQVLLPKRTSRPGRCGCWPVHMWRIILGCQRAAVQRIELGSRWPAAIRSCIRSYRGPSHARTGAISCRQQLEHDDRLGIGSVATKFGGLKSPSCAAQAMMVHECLPQDAPLAGGKQYDTWATQIYQELSGAPDSALFAAPCCRA